MNVLLLSIAEAQQQLGGTGRTTIYKLIGQGDLAAVKVGRRTFITYASLTTYVDNLVPLGLPTGIRR
jgi:excisionase family DNA binding protein